MNWLIILTSQLILYVSGRTTKTTNQSGVELIKLFEEFRPDFYNDQLGSKTIGYGHACHGDGTNCGGLTGPLSMEAATHLLHKDLVPREACVTNSIEQEMNSNQFAAFVSLVFNMGCEAFRATPIINQFNRNDIPGTARTIRSLTTMNGVFLQDLVVRREAEMKLFCTDSAC